MTALLPVAALGFLLLTVIEATARRERARAAQARANQQANQRGTQ